MSPLVVNGDDVPPAGTAKVPSAFRNFPAAADPAGGAGTSPCVPPDPESPTISVTYADTFRGMLESACHFTLRSGPAGAAGVESLRLIGVGTLTQPSILRLRLRVCRGKDGQDECRLVCHSDGRD